MPGTTGVGLPYPLYTDPADVPGQLEALAVALDGIYTGQQADIAAMTERQCASIGTGGAQSIPNSTSVTLTFTSEDFDNDNMADIATHPTSLIVQTHGFYLVKGILSYAGNATGNREITLFQNGVIIGGQKGAASVGSSSSRLTVSALTTLFVGDVITAQTFQNSGAALNVTTRNLQAVLLSGF